jgi:hypothetical protein
MSFRQVTRESPKNRSFQGCQLVVSNPVRLCEKVTRRLQLAPWQAFQNALVRSCCEGFVSLEVFPEATQ